MQHKNTQNLTKKYRISAVCKHLLMIQLSKTRLRNMRLMFGPWDAITDRATITADRLKRRNSIRSICGGERNNLVDI